jgi:hypothetical protein
LLGEISHTLPLYEDIKYRTTISDQREQRAQRRAAQREQAERQQAQAAQARRHHNNKQTTNKDINHQQWVWQNRQPSQIE